MPGDAPLFCRDRGGCVTFSVTDRLSFAVVGHRYAPSRCSVCRAARKTRKAASGDDAVAPRFRELEQPQTTVICSSCGKSMTVPFAARPGRNVNCSAHFQRHRGRLEGR